MLSEERPKEQKGQGEEKRSKNGTLRYSAHEGRYRGISSSNTDT